MKILHINTSDINGGAARAAYRLHRALLAQNVDSHMLVQTKASDDRFVIGPGSKLGKGLGRVRPTVDQLPSRLYTHRQKTPFHSAWLPFSGVTKKMQEIDPDVIHLHWIVGGFVRIEDLAKIQKPIVWSLHDMWAFTGGCHYDGDCGKYISKCRACPVFGSTRSKDLCHWVFQRKQKHWSKISHLTINGLSRWLADCAAESALFKNRKVVNLPNLIDTENFKPLSKDQAKQILGLEPGKKHVLFGAMNATGDERKGFSELVQALKHVQGDNIELAVFGSNEPEDAPRFPFPTRYLGRLQDDILLRIHYSAADVMVVPSKQENLSNTIMEALACGTPVVGFAIGGNGDMIEHLNNGYLAEPFEPQDLAKGIDWVLNHPEPAKLSEATREKVVREFDSRVVAEKYVELYEEVLGKK